MPYAVEAPFNSCQKQHERTCLPETRVGLLEEIFSWAERRDGQCIFWLNGLAGTGKSTIARTIARKYYDQQRLGASFFFSRGKEDVSNAGKFCTSIAVQLANDVPPVQRYIFEAITERSDIARRSLQDQWRQLVLYPLSKLDSSTFSPPYILVVDALDECDDTNDIRTILQLLAEARSLERVQLRVLITSRPEIPIRYGFHQIPDDEHRDFILHNIEAATVDQDISVFLDHELTSIRREQNFGVAWPGEQNLKQLVLNASGLFIWAATACRFIREGRGYAAKRLSRLLGGSATTSPPEEQLNKIYLTVLKNSIHDEYSEEEKQDMYSMLRKVLGTVVVLYSPLPVNSLGGLFYLPKENIEQALADLHAILDIPEDTNQPLRLHHPSFRDFLLNKDRCSDPKFWVDERQAHRTLANDCIQLMSNSLKQDVCGQKAPGTLVANIKSSRIEQCLPSEVRYACLYWIQHLQKSDTQLCDNDYVYKFLREHLLHWLEALGWIRKTSEGILAILSLEAQIQVSVLCRVFLRRNHD